MPPALLTVAGCPLPDFTPGPSVQSSPALGTDPQQAPTMPMTLCPMPSSSPRNPTNDRADGGHCSPAVLHLSTGSPCHSKAARSVSPALPLGDISNAKDLHKPHNSNGAHKSSCAGPSSTAGSADTASCIPAVKRIRSPSTVTSTAASPKHPRVRMPAHHASEDQEAPSQPNSASHEQQHNIPTVCRVTTLPEGLSHSASPARPLLKDSSLHISRSRQSSYGTSSLSSPCPVVLPPAPATAALDASTTPPASPREFHLPTSYQLPQRTPPKLRHKKFAPALAMFADTLRQERQAGGLLQPTSPLRKTVVAPSAQHNMEADQPGLLGSASVEDVVQYGATEKTKHPQENLGQKAQPHCAGCCGGGDDNAERTRARRKWMDQCLMGLQQLVEETLQASHAKATREGRGAECMLLKLEGDVELSRSYTSTFQFAAGIYKPQAVQHLHDNLNAHLEDPRTEDLAKALPHGPPKPVWLYAQNLDMRAKVQEKFCRLDTWLKESNQVARASSILANTVPAASATTSKQAQPPPGLSTTPSSIRVTPLMANIAKSLADVQLECKHRLAAYQANAYRLNNFNSVMHAVAADRASQGRLWAEARVRQTARLGALRQEVQAVSQVFAACQVYVGQQQQSQQLEVAGGAEDGGAESSSHAEGDSTECGDVGTADGAEAVADVKEQV